jgi:hypothetical protein
MATALALTISPIAQERSALAQQAGEASAEVDADATESNADAAADASAAQSSEQSDAQATPTEQADTQSNATDNAADAPMPPPSDEGQDATGAPQDPQTPDANANNRAAPGTGPALPPPTNGADAAQRRERSALVEGQQPTQQAPATTRGQTDVRGRANVDVRTGRDRQQDLRAGIQFGRATDRGLTINQIEPNSFYHSSGFRRGDVIVSVHGQRIRSDADFLRFIVSQPSQRVPVVVLRDGRRETIYFQYRDMADRQLGYNNRRYQSDGAYLGVMFDAQVRDAAVVRDVAPGSPAAEAQLMQGDLILALDGRETMSYQDAISTVRGMRPGDRLDIIVERGPQQLQLEAVLGAAAPIRAAYDTRTTERRVIAQPFRPGIEVEAEDGDWDGDDDRIIGRDRDDDGEAERRILRRRVLD